MEIENNIAVVFIKTQELSVLVDLINTYQGGLSYTLEGINLNELRDKLKSHIK